MYPEDETRRELTPELTRIQEKFYDSLRACSIRSMDGVWSHSEEVMCCHPGWAPLKGWKAIRESWSSIFRNTHMHQVATEILASGVHERTAWVTCVERIGVVYGDSVSVGYSVSTNVYELIDASWLLVNHHSSPLLGDDVGADER